jgi:hypothetical protein
MQHTPARHDDGCHSPSELREKQFTADLTRGRIFTIQELGLAIVIRTP